MEEQSGKINTQNMWLQEVLKKDEEQRMVESSITE